MTWKNLINDLIYVGFIFLLIITLLNTCNKKPVGLTNNLTVDTLRITETVTVNIDSIKKVLKSQLKPIINYKEKLDTSGFYEYCREWLEANNPNNQYLVSAQADTVIEDKDGLYYTYSAFYSRIPLDKEGYFELVTHLNYAKLEKIFAKTIEIEKPVLVEKEESFWQRFGIVLYGGYGYSYESKRIEPQAGVGIGFRIF